MGTHPIFESDFDCLTEMCDSFFIVGPDNRPIYQDNTSAISPLESSFISHSSLDILFEKLNETREAYLGLLYENESYKVYGYCSTSKVKILAIYGNQLPTRDNEAKHLLKSLHLSYIDVISNPFYDGQINSEKFQTATRALLRKT